LFFILSGKVLATGPVIFFLQRKFSHFRLFCLGKANSISVAHGKGLSAIARKTAIEKALIRASAHLAGSWASE
jgi:hypothetical protein